MLGTWVHIKKVCKHLLFLSVIALGSCEHGLAPSGDETGLLVPGFGGTITVVSSWPPIDSLNILAVVAFRNFPPKNILEEFNNGTLLFYDGIKANENVQSFEIHKEGLSGIFEYIVVAQQYGANPFTDWRVVGVYHSGDVTKPTPVNLGPGVFRTGVNIDVDFYNLPPQPF